MGTFIRVHCFTNLFILLSHTWRAILGGMGFFEKTCRPGTAVRQAGEGGQMGIIDMHGGSHVTAVYTKFQP